MKNTDSLTSEDAAKLRNVISVLVKLQRYDVAKDLREVEKQVIKKIKYQQTEELLKSIEC